MPKLKMVQGGNVYSFRKSHVERMIESRNSDDANFSASNQEVNDIERKFQAEAKKKVFMSRYNAWAKDDEKQAA